MSNLNLINSLYKEFGLRNTEELAKICHDKIEWHQCAGFPGGGQHIGVNEIIEKVFNGNASRWKSFEFVRKEMLEAHDTVTVIGDYKVTSHSGKQASAKTVHIFKVLEGKVQSFWQYTDTKILWDCLN